jgi:segregation and condensation protein B
MDERERNKAVLEAIVFLSGEPVMLPELKSVTGMNESEIKDLMEELISDYAERGGGILIGKIAGGYQMHTSHELSDLIRKFRKTERTQKLSLPALETLAIIAYKQPITKAEVEDLRGVNSDGVVKTLLDRRMIKIVGKKEVPGKPLLYATTREFLEYFGLDSLVDLPTLKDLDREDAA